MSTYQTDEVSSHASDLYHRTIQSGLVPVITDQGIAVGSCLIKPSDGFFVIYKNNHEHYRTFSKSAAMIIARLMNRKVDLLEINSIINADRKAFSARNDLEIYKHFYTVASKRNDTVKKMIMEDRFQSTNDKYQSAKKIIKDSYSRLFLLADK